MDKEYTIGYKKPPKNSQFKKGKSGNPKGRPKGAKNKNPFDILSKALMKKVKIIEDGEEKFITCFEAIYKKLLVDAIKGKPSAMRQALKQIDSLAQANMIEEKDDNKITVEIVSAENYSP